MNDTYPWHDAQWRRVVGGYANGRIAHAWLLSGAKGLGKAAFARAFAQTMLCPHAETSGVACGRCDSCHLYAVGNHPDVYIVEPEEDAKTIAVDQVRAISGFMSLMPQHGRARVVIVNQAHAMNVHSSNGLLKNLEEPPPHGKFILVTDKRSALLPTIRSRCQHLEFPVPTPAIARTWLLSQNIDGDVDVALALADGAPLRALSLIKQQTWSRRAQTFDEFVRLLNNAGDPVAMAAKWAESPEELLSWMESWLSDLATCKLAPAIGRWRNPDFAATLVRVAQSLDARSIFSALDGVNSALRGLNYNVNQQLALEGVLIGCATKRVTAGAA